MLLCVCVCLCVFSDDETTPYRMFTHDWTGKVSSVNIEQGRAVVYRQLFRIVGWKISVKSLDL